MGVICRLGCPIRISEVAEIDRGMGRATPTLPPPGQREGLKEAPTRTK